MKIFFKSLNMIIFICSWSMMLMAQELETHIKAPDESAEADIENRSKKLDTNVHEDLYRHWSALADLYMKIGQSELADMALNYARQLEAKLTANRPKPLSTILHNNFESYFYGWFNQSVENVLATTAPTLLLPLYADGLSKTEQKIFFQELFATYPQLQELSIEDLYNLESLTVTQFDNSKAMLSIRSVTQAPESLLEWSYWSNFWNNTHHYFFQRIGVDEWYLLAFDMDEYQNNDLFIAWEHGQ